MSNYSDHEYHNGYSKDYQGNANSMSASHSEVQTAGDVPYQDPTPPSFYNGGGVGFSGPLSPAPATAPPPPPPSESDVASVRSDDDSDAFLTVPTPPTVRRQQQTEEHLYYPSSSASTTSAASSKGSNHYGSYSSYQSNARVAEVPTITNYGVSPSQNFYPSRKQGEAEPLAPKVNVTSSFRGDATIRPNTGQTNDEYGGIGSLREVTSRLRWMTIGCALTALVWEGFAFPARLLVHTWDHAAKVVLGGYLAAFSLLLLGVELNAPLRDNFGVLYHPLGRAFLLIVMSTMCFGILIAWWESLLCVAFFGCSCGYLYAYIKYPEYRRWQDYHDNHVWADMRSAVRQQAFGDGAAADWADPAQRTAANVFGFGTGTRRPPPQSWHDTQRETQALLHQV